MSGSRRYFARGMRFAWRVFILGFSLFSYIEPCRILLKFTWNFAIFPGILRYKVDFQSMQLEDGLYDDDDFDLEDY